MDRTQEILELFKLYSANEMKSLQTKFTNMGKGVKSEALDGKISAIFTLEQKEILEQAASILMSTKSSIEHAKEIKARAEREQERAIKIAKTEATTYLKELVSDLSLAEKISLIFSDRMQVGWPYSDTNVILETAKGERRGNLDRDFRGAVDDWINSISDSMAWDSLPDSFGEQIEITKEVAFQRVEKAISKADRYQVLADEIMQIVKSREFLDSVKKDLAVDTTRKQ